MNNTIIVKNATFAESIFTIQFFSGMVKVNVICFPIDECGRVFCINSFMYKKLIELSCN